MGELHSTIDTLAADDVHAMAESQLLERTETLLHARKKLDAELARTLQATDIRDVTVNEAGRQTRGWLIEEQFMDPTAAGQLLWIARRLPSYPAIAAALADGAISLDHARTLIGTLSRLTPQWAQACHDELLDFAQIHDPAMLKELCREIRVRSGAEEDAEARAQRQYDSRYLSISTTFEGMVHLDGMFDPAMGATIKAAIDAVVDSATSEGDYRTRCQRNADALHDLADQALRHHDLPDHAGERPQVMVTTSLEELRNGIAANQLPTSTLNGHQISPNTARMTACDARIIPVVLGSHGEVLDLGRSCFAFAWVVERTATG